MHLPRASSHLLTLTLICAALALASACTSEDPDAAFSTHQAAVHGDSPYAETFETVARESGVPVEYLVGIAWVESRFATHPDEPSEPGGHGSPWLGHGMMRLVDGHTLERAAALTGLDVEVLRTDPAANLRGAAAVLAELHRETGSWDEALLRYGPGGLGIDERAARAWVEDVEYAAKWGVSGVDSDQRSLVFDGVGDPDDDGQFGTLEQRARPDYGGASWQGPVCSGNYSNASRGAGQITDIVIHTCQGGYSGCWGWLKNCQSGVSAHYVVSSTGQIVQIVEEQDIAYHDGCFNTNSVGIEHEGFINDPGRWYTDEMYCASAKLTRSICDRNNITCTRANVRGHGETPDCSTHTDPGSGWNWNKYMEYVNCGCNGCCQAQTEVCNGKDDDCDNSVDEGDVCEIELLNDQINAYAPATTSDVNGDGLADVCGRGASGIFCRLVKTSADGWKAGNTEVRPAWGDDNGWDDVSNYATLRMGDVNGDGMADICGRGNNALRCALGTPDGFAPSTVWRDAFADSSGWKNPRLYTTIRLADVNGDGMDDICFRTNLAFNCRLSDGQAFATLFAGPELSNDNGWDDADNYGTIRMADINGDGRADVCARANARMRCWPAGASGFGARIDGPIWSNERGFNKLEQWATIRVGDVDGDGNDDLCARSADELQCAVSKGDSFRALETVYGHANSNGWSDIDNWATIRMGDFNGDGRDDICGRGNGGIHCHWRRDDGTWGRVNGVEWSDDVNWDTPNRFHTLTMADVNGDGRDDVCGRGSSGWRCSISEGNSFGALWTMNEFTNAKGWNAARHWRTLISGGPRGPLCMPVAEVCNQLDDDCDDQIDEDGVCDQPDPEPTDVAPGEDTAPGEDLTPEEDMRLDDDDTSGPGGDVSLGDAPGVPDTGAPGDDVVTDATLDAGVAEPPPSLGSADEGCGCRTMRDTREPVRWPLAALSLLGIGLAVRRRRRRGPRKSP